MMRTLHRLLTFAFIATFLLQNCQSPESPDQGILIQGIPELSVVKSDEIIGPLEIEVIGRDGLSSFSIEINGIQIVQKSLSGEITFRTPFTYFTNHLDEGKTIQITFSATDIDGDTEKKSLNFKVNDGINKVFLESDITSDQTWSSGNIYILNGRIVVRPGATLTIEKGTIVKASERLNQDIPSGLVISRGAKIIAEGTSTEPIIFTSIYSTLGTSVEGNYTLSDQIITWDAGPLGNGKAQILDNAKWGGITILGNAKGSFIGNSNEVYLSNIPQPEDIGKYGGDILEDNSGILKHVTIFGSGIQKFEKYKIGGLTLAGVGSGTTIENVEIGGGQADGLVIRGGNVNLKNIVVMDYPTAINIGQGWSGVLENFYLIFFIDKGIEINGPEGNYFDKNHLLSKGTFNSCTEPPAQWLIYFNEKSNTDMSKIFFSPIGWQLSAINLFPTRFSPKISELMVPTLLEYEKVFPQEFHPFFVPFSENPGAPGADISKFDWHIYEFYMLEGAGMDCF